MKFKNTFKIEVVRDGKVVHEQISENLVTTQGATKLLDIMFDGTSAINPWYLGLIEGASPTLSIDDTHASHGGWTEFTDYSGNRPVYNPDDPANGIAVNTGTLAEFIITAAGTIGGAFLASNNTKGSTSSSYFLFSETAYASSYTVAINDIYRVSYTLALVAA